MKVKYALDKIDESIFLAGPTPRSNDVASWRPRALELLEEYKFEGTVIVPEREDWSSLKSYDEQIAWELKGLRSATKIVFWVPREIETMPAFTTNVEFGLFARSGKTFYGRPDQAPKTRYLDYIAEEASLKIYNTLERLLKDVVVLQ